jgi:hypothetical protein
MEAGIVKASEEACEASGGILLFFFMVLENLAREDKDRVCK